MLASIAITAPIFLLIAAGYGAVASGRFPHEAAAALGRFVITFAIPALIFNALVSRSLDEVVNGPFLLAYGGGSLLAFGIGLAVSTLLRRGRPADNALSGMGVSMSNSAFIGYPLIAQLLGESALIAVALAMVVETLLILPLTLMLAESARAVRGAGSVATVRAIARQIATNPILLAIVAALICAALQWQPPAVLARAIDMVASSAAGVALFAIGGSLVGLRLRAAAVGASLIASGKLLVHPLAVAMMVALLPEFDSALTQAALVLAMLPMVTIFPLLGQRYGQGEISATALLIATTASFATINIAIWWFDLGVS